MTSKAKAPNRQEARGALQSNPDAASLTTAFDILWPESTPLPAWLRPVLHKVYADGAQQGNWDAHADVEVMTNPYDEPTTDQAKDER